MTVFLYRYKAHKEPHNKRLEIMKSEWILIKLNTLDFTKVKTPAKQ